MDLIPIMLIKEIPDRYIVNGRLLAISEIDEKWRCCQEGVNSSFQN